MATSKSSVFIRFLFVAAWLAQLVAARSPPELDSREAKQLLLTPYLPYYTGVPVINTYPIPAGKTTNTVSSSLGPFFGYFPEMFGGKPCECPAPPAACPATTQPATIEIPSTSSCTTDSIRCTQMTAAPNGSFKVTIDNNSAETKSVVGILTVCPNTKVTLTCATIPSGITVTGKSGDLTAGNAVEVTGGSAIFQIASTTSVAANADVTCTWVASP